MNKCEQYCRTIKRMCNITAPGLPSEYQQVEYLQSTGTQYIITGVPIDRTTETRCVGVFTPGAGEASSLVGGRNDNSTNGRYIPLGVTGANANYLRFTYDGNGGESWIISTNINSVVFNDAEHKAYCNGDLVATYNGGALSVNTKRNVTLFGMMGYDDANVSWKTKGKLYSASFYNNETGEKLGDFIPCYRKSDSKPGMYDLVTETFYTNQGTGEFTVGPDV